MLANGLFKLPDLFSLVVLVANSDESSADLVDGEERAHKTSKDQESLLETGQLLVDLDLLVEVDLELYEVLVVLTVLDVALERFVNVVLRELGVLSAEMTDLSAFKLVNHENIGDGPVLNACGELLQGVRVV